jgi:hypothetical protein
MSAKSERKKKVYEEKKNGVVPKTAAPPPTMMFAEDVDKTLKDHLASCTDPHCTNQFVNHYRDIKLVAMLENGNKKQVFLAPYGGYTSHDYKPLFILNLATGEEINDLFDDHGCAVSECCHNPQLKNEPICLSLTCHNKGVDLSFNMKEPDSITLVCAEPTCRNPLTYKGFNGELRLAPRPKAEYPKIFCNAHGIQPAYLICDHVGHGATPLVLGHPTDDQYGIALCGDACYRELVKNGGRHTDKFHSACAPSLKELLGDKLTKAKVTATVGQER